MMEEKPVLLEETTLKQCDVAAHLLPCLKRGVKKKRFHQESFLDPIFHQSYLGPILGFILKALG